MDWGGGFPINKIGESSKARSLPILTHLLKPSSHGPYCLHEQFGGEIREREQSRAFKASLVDSVK